MKVFQGILVWLAAVFTFEIYAQNPGYLLNRLKYDSTYVESYYDHFLHVTLVTTSMYQSLDVSGSGNNRLITYEPNNAYRFGIGLDYRFMSLEYTQTIDALDIPDPVLGNTRSTALRLGVTGRRFLASALIQRFRGMYISNPEDLQSQGVVLQNRIRGDLLSEMVLGSVYYFFNPQQFSAMAGLWQIDRQKKTAGSFAAGITFSVSHLLADSTLIPSYLLLNPVATDLIKENYNYLVGMNAGYACTLVEKHRLFLHFLMLPGLNVQYSKIKTETGEETSYKARAGYHGDLRIVAGYNGELYYGGVHYSNYFNSNTIQSTVDVNQFNTYFRVFFGRRLDVRRNKR